MTKVTGSISQKGVRGSLSQLGVIGTIAVLGVVGTLAECGHDNPIPVLQSATIENADPSKIILTYDIALNESYVPELVNYIIVGVFYISIEVSGNTVIINIDPPAVYGDVVEINYYNNIIDGVALRSEAGALAASFTSYPVTNNVLQSYPAELANRFFWYDPSDLTTITKDGSNIISRVNDKLGNGNDLVTGSALWTANTILFNGTSQYLKTGAIAAMTQPVMIYMIIKQVTYSFNDYICEGLTSNSAVVIQKGSPATFDCYSGVFLGVNNNMAGNTWAILRVYFNGVNSKSIVNNTAPVTGNVGLNNPLGFTLGASKSGTLNGNIQVKDIIAMPSDTGETDIYNWLVTRL